jgi:hypothetical protein
MKKYHDFSSDVLQNAQIRLEYLTTAGPRIVGLSYRGSPNLLADVHDIFLESPHGPYFPLGGHRLWISPESPEKTYIPDKGGLRVREIPSGIELTGASETSSGVRKTLRIELEPASPIVRLVHTILNENPAPVTFAPWALTMACQGGTVILPQPVGNTDPHGLLSNRLLVLWPYTRINDTRFVLRDDFILIHAEAALPPLKLGYANKAGWLGYWRNGILLRKSFDLHPGAAYPDGGCNTEVYCGDRVVELESLGPLVTLATGQVTQLTETWELYTGLDQPFIPAELRDLLHKEIASPE